MLTHLCRLSTKNVVSRCGEEQRLGHSLTVLATTSVSVKESKLRAKCKTVEWARGGEKG